VPNYPGHLLGTARMGLDPGRSVVNEWGRYHDVKNLFMVDGSIWITSGGVNPTSTIQALALYIADNIKKRLATLFDWAELCPMYRNNCGNCVWRPWCRSLAAMSCWRSNASSGLEFPLLRHSPTAARPSQVGGERSFRMNNYNV
jgi:hypothetical protein